MSKLESNSPTSEQIYEQHAEDASMVSRWQEKLPAPNLENIPKETYGDYGKRHDWSKTNQQVKRYQDRLDANLWRANQHKEQNLEQYIAEAKADAEVAGVHINISQPKE